MSIPLIQKPEKDDINTSIIAIKRNIERINMLLGLVDTGGNEPDLSGFATKQELQDAVTELQPVDEVTVGNMQSVTSNAVSKALSYSTTEHKTGKKWIDGKDIYELTIEYGDGITIIPQGTEITIFNNVSIDKIIKWNGTSIYDSSVDYVLPNGYTMMYNRHTNIGYTETSMQSKKLSITLEYTKTTD